MIKTAQLCPTHKTYIHLKMNYFYVRKTYINQSVGPKKENANKSDDAAADISVMLGRMGMK